MHRYFVTGTDTDVGKTRVAAGLALALRDAGLRPTVVKIAQTGVSAEEEGDAQRAARFSCAPWRELARFAKPADPWAAALSAGAHPLEARKLAAEIDAITGCIVTEGAGGVMVPLNERQEIGDVAVLAKLQAVIVVGLRLGCINHALLTLDRCTRLGIPIAGAVLVERWNATAPDYRADVRRALEPRAHVLGVIGCSQDEAASVARAAKLFESLVKQER